MIDPTERFSSRADTYAKYRPTYPSALLDLLAAECGLTRDSTVVDVGSGTGLLTELFLAYGNRVYSVEPNREMRACGEQRLRSYRRFVSVEGTAEQTALEDGCADFVIAGQAFHWFDLAATRKEFVRILKPHGWTVLVWNERRRDASPFLIAYECLLQEFATDYKAFGYDRVDPEMICSFFGTRLFSAAEFENKQVFDFEGLRGRFLSSSYAPEPGHPNFGPILDGLRSIFDRHNVNGQVVFEYRTRVYYGQLRLTAALRS